MDVPIIFRMYNDKPDEKKPGQIVGLLPTISSGHGPHGILAFTKDNHDAIFTSTADMQPQITSAVDLTDEDNLKTCLVIIQKAVHAGYYPLDVCMRIMEHMNEQRRMSLKHLTSGANKKVSRDKLQRAA